MLKKVNLRYLVPVILIALVVALLLRTFVVQAYKVSTPSMEEALLAGEFFLVNKLSYKFKGSSPRPNDIVVFGYPLNPKKLTAKGASLPEDRRVRTLTRPRT